MEMVIASGLNVSDSLSQHFGYELSDKKAKANFLKGANREALDIQERQKCVMIDLSTGAYLELIIPAVNEWGKVEGIENTIDYLNIVVEEVNPGYDENFKHVQSIVRFVVNSNRVTVTCYNTTQRVKVEGKGYIEFVKKFFKPYLMKKLSKEVHEKIDSYNKEVIAALSGKRKAVTRPMRSVRYKAMAQLPCSKCDLSFKNDAQLKRHKTVMHTKGPNDSIGCTINELLVEDISLSESDSGDIEVMNTKEYLPIEYSEEKETKHVTTNIESSCQGTDKEESTKEHQEESSVDLPIQDLLNDTGPSIQIQTLEETSEQDIKCNFCDFTLPTLLDLNSHIQTKHKSNNTITVAAIIEDPSKSSSSSENNMHDPVICCLCKLESKNINELRKHIEMIHTNQAVTQYKQDTIECVGTETFTICNKCTSFTGSKEELNEHSKSNHAPAVACDQCGNNFPDIKTLKEHVGAKHFQHHKIEPFPCEWCGLYFLNFGLLEQHVQSFHGNHESEDCHFCKQIFPTLEELQAHMRQSHEEIVILCTMGKQVDEVADKLERLTNQMEFMMETQNAMKQELFILRNAQITATKNEDNPQPQMQSGVAQTKKKQSPQKVQKMSMSFNSEERPKETQLPPAQKVKEGNAKTLFIGDSISSVVDLDALKEATETEIKHIKAYSSVFDTVSNGAKRPAIFPHKNFTDVIPAALKQDTFKNMIVQCGSVDIRNLQTKHYAEKSFDLLHCKKFIFAL